MIELSNKIKALIVGAAFLLVAIIVAVVVLVVNQNSKIAKIESLGFSVANQQMMVGEQKELAVSVYPSNAKDKTIVFSSSNSNVIKIVSSTTNSVVIEAVSIGNASIRAVAKTNNKVVDSCNVQVSDSSATSIIIENQFAQQYVGKKVEIPILLEPAGANYQKLQVASYDSNIVGQPEIVVEENSAKFVCDVLGVGSGSVVVAFMAERNQTEEPVLYKQIQVVGKAAEISSLTFTVWSISQQSYSAQEPNFMIGAYDEYKFRLNYENLNGAIITTTEITPLFDENIFDVSVVNSDYVVKLKDGASDWGHSQIMFDYKGKQLVLNFNYYGSWPTEFEVAVKGKSKINNAYELNSETAYVLEISNNIKELIAGGFAHLELDAQYEEIALDGLVLSCNKKMNLRQIGIVLKFDYWNAVSANDVTQYMIIKVVDKDYDE